LFDRQHQTKANEFISTCQHINASILQGSGMDPVTYLLNASALRPMTRITWYFNMRTTPTS